MRAFMEWIMIVLLLSQCLTILLLLWLVLTKKDPDSHVWTQQFQRLESQIAQTGRMLTQAGTDSARENREEMARSLAFFTQQTIDQFKTMADLQRQHLADMSAGIRALTSTNDTRSDILRDTVEKKLEDIRRFNLEKLDEMKAVVEEKLQSSLERRLGESFTIISDRLEKVHHGLGEMQSLASGVGDLKKILSNNRARGIWGEVQLAALLQQILAPDQFDTNVATKPESAERVEFAIKLPGKDHKFIWLPIDAKFPQDTYQHVLDAEEKNDPGAVRSTGLLLEQRLKKEARQIREKYIHPPDTTDFAILFVPVEGLYAEILRRPGLYDTIQQDYRIIVAGPTTLTAILNSLQLGFRTLAIERRSGEIWALLQSLKREFSTFTLLLSKTRQKLLEAGNTIEDANRKSRTIERRLGAIEQLEESSETSALSNHC